METMNVLKKRTFDKRQSVTIYIHILNNHVLTYCLFQDDSDAEETERKIVSSPTDSSIVPVSFTTPTMLNKPCGIDKRNKPASDDDVTKMYFPQNQNQSMEASQKISAPPSYSGVHNTTETDDSLQLVDDVTDKVLESDRGSTIPTTDFDAEQATSHMTFSFNRAKLYRSFKDLTLKLDISGQIPIASARRHSMCSDSGVGMLPLNWYNYGDRP